MADPELSAVEAALNTLALATTDAALEKVVHRLLPGLLSALATPSAPARAKIVETLSHINVRVAASPAVAMPFHAVLAAASTPDAAPMTRNVAIQGGYVERCFRRCPAPGDVFKLLVEDGAKVAGDGNKDVLFAIALRALEARVKTTATGSNSDEFFKQLLDEVPEDALLAFLSYGQRAMRAKVKAVPSKGQLLALVRLCVEFAGLQRPDRAVIVFPTLLVAAGIRSRDAVASAGEDGLKRIDTCDVLLAHDPLLVHTLFHIFLDSAAEISLRTIVLSKGLLRATLSASCFPDVLHVVDQAVYKPGIPDRLRSLGMQYVSFVVANGSPETLAEHGHDLLRGMLKVIQDDTGGSPSFSPIVRGFAHTALAEILLKVPSLRATHAAFAPALFFTAAQSASEPPEVRAAASHALSTLAPVFSVEDGGAAVVHRAGLLKTLRAAVANRDALAAPARNAAVLWANVCFGFGDAEARVINIIAAGDDRPDVQESGKAGLSARRYRSLALRTDHARKLKDAPSGDDVDGMEVDSGADETEAAADAETEVKFPEFGMLMNLVGGLIDSGESGGGEPLVLNALSWAAFFRFALLTLRRNVQESQAYIKSSKPDVWRGASAGEVDLFLARPENTHLHTSLEKLQAYSRQCLLDDGVPGGASVERAALCIVLFSAEIDSEAISASYVKHVDGLVSLCTKKCAGGGGAVVDGVARLTGFASTALPVAELERLIAKLAVTLEPEASGRASGRHGEDDRECSILCISQIIASNLSKPGATGQKHSNSMIRALGAVARRFQGAVESSVRVRVAACDALAAVGTKHILPLPLDSADGIALELSVPTRAVVLAGLAGVLISDKSDAKLVEAAANAIGRICVGEPRTTFKRTAINALLLVAKDRKEDEVRFTAGESLVRATAGFDAPPPASLRKEEDATDAEELPYLLYSGTNVIVFSRPIGDLAGDEPESESAKPTSLESVLNAVCELCFNPRPHTRAGGCVYLVTFLRLISSPHAVTEKVQYTFPAPEDEVYFAAAQDALAKVVPKAQGSFTTLLADRSEFTQQLASRGVSLLFDMSTESDRKELVTSLVRSLTMNKRNAAATVAGDEGGVLDSAALPTAPPSAGNGDTSSTSNSSTGGAATYKELVSLANDMGQPELVYKFMDLASHSSLWNNRRGAALAGSALLGNDLAAEQLRPHIKTLLPRLYVYCYDPSEAVRVSMGSVLSSVAKSGGFGTVSEAVNEHFDIVAKHCLSCMTSRQWRVREGGCGALRDLLPSRRWSEVKDLLGEFWLVSLRAMDDIKESVRTVGERAGQAVSALSIRLCDPNMNGAGSAAAVVEIVVPAILPAFTHGVKEVRVLASSTLSKIIRFGGNALRASVPDIVTSLLESATELENPALNYVQFHVDADQRDQLETMRADAASMSSSPIVDSLERLSGLVDDSNAGEVVQRLLRLSRVGVGVPTRAATARFFSSLLSSRGVVMEKHAAKMMHAATAAAQMEMNGSARKAWSNAVGLAARLAPVEAVGKMVAVIVELSGAESAQDRALASYLSLGLWRNSPETARKHATEILPVAYMGRYEGDEDAKGAAANWKEVWSEGSPSSDAGLRLYSSEITCICVRRLSVSSQYKVKSSAASALGAMAHAMTSATASSVGNESLATAAAGLIGALPGHIWENKQGCLDAIGTIADAASKSKDDAAERTRAVWSKVGGSDAVVKAILVECDRGKREYRLSAMSALAHVLKGSCETSDYVSVVTAALGSEWSRADADADADAETAAEVARTVWETGSDANAVDTRNKARAALRAVTIAAITCLASAFPPASCSGTQETHVAEVVSALSGVVGGERTVRTAGLTLLGSVIERLGSGLLAGETLESAVAAATVGCTDARYGGVRGAAFGVVGAISKLNGDVESAFGTERWSLVTTAAEKDLDGGRVEAKKLFEIIGRDISAKN